MISPNDKPEPITYFGQTDSRGRRTPFGIKSKDRSRHMYVIGKTGMGKSTLLENMAIQDIKNGHGVCFIDPHGKTADLLLEYVPEHRIKDVLYFAPFDMDFPVSFNIMEDVGADKRHLVVNGLMATFEKIWVDAWSARMAYILQNTLLALLEYTGSTLLGVNRMLVDKEYRRLVVNNITDPSVRSFWVDEFAKYTDRYTQEATPAIQNKVGQFASNPLIRNIIGQSKSTFDLRTLMDESKIIIVNLSKGKVGEGNANLLGSMFITKVYLAAMSRADVTETELNKLPNFYLFVDEFQSFANKSFADILSEARKYKLNLTLAHQYIEQMEEEVRFAVFGNVGTMVVFRVGAFDAEFLEKEFAPALTAEDLVSLGIYQAYLKLMIDGVTSPPFSAVTLPPIEKSSRSYRDEVIASSRAQFARPRDIVEQEIKDWHLPIAPVAKERPPEAPKAKERPTEAQRAPESPREREPQREPIRDSGRAQRGEVRAGDPERSLRKDAQTGESRQFVRQERDHAQSAPSANVSAPARTVPSDSELPPRRQERPSTQPSVPSSPAPSPTPVSLSHLSAGAKKGASGGAHLSELRKALSDVLQNAPRSSAPAGSVENERVKSQPSRETPPVVHSQGERSGNGAGQRQSANTLREAPREIPEDMLRKLLTVDRPDAPPRSGGLKG